LSVWRLCTSSPLPRFRETFSQQGNMKGEKFSGKEESAGLKADGGVG